MLTLFHFSSGQNSRFHARTTELVVKIPTSQFQFQLHSPNGAMELRKTSRRDISGGLVMARLWTKFAGHGLCQLVVLLALSSSGTVQAQLGTFQPDDRSRGIQGVDPRLVQPRLLPPTPQFPQPNLPRWKMGIEGEDFDVGVRVTEVYRPTPASRAGIEVDDIIITVNGYQVGIVNGQLFDIGEEFQKRADSRGYVNLLIWNHRDRTLANRVVRLERSLIPNPPSRLSTLVGTVTYRERMALPPNSVVEVRLVDITDNPRFPRVLVDEVIENPRSVPVSFRLNFDGDEIDQRRIYAIDAQIWTQGRLQWSTATPVQVITRGNPNRSIDLMLTRSVVAPVFDGGFGR